MNNLIKFGGRKKFVDRANVRDVAVNKSEWFTERCDVRERAPLDLRVVKIVQIVERPDLVTVMEQPFANVRANEARAASDEKIHAATLTTATPSVERGAMRKLFLPKQKEFGFERGNFSVSWQE
jgi:hypothetical protein